MIVIVILQTDLCVETINKNKDNIIGVKVRLDKNITNNGENEREVFKQALLAARTARVPLMIHHTNSTISLEEVLDRLDKGDVYTHTFRHVITIFFLSSMNELSF